MKSMKPTKKKRMWISRDASGDYELWMKDKPMRSEEKQYFGEGCAYSFCATIFHVATNLRLSPGQLVEIERPIKIKVKRKP